MALVSTLDHHCSASPRAEAARMCREIAGAHGICPEVHSPVPEFATLAGGDCVSRIPWALAALGVGLFNPKECPRAVHMKLQSFRGNVVTLPTDELRHRDTCRLTLRHATPWHGHHLLPHHLFPDNVDLWQAAVQQCLSQCTNKHLHYYCRQQGPTDQPGWRDALVNLSNTNGTKHPHLRLNHPTRAKQGAHTGRPLILDGLHLHVGGYRRKGDLSLPPQEAG